MQIYTADTALRAEDAVFAKDTVASAAPSLNRATRNAAVDESSLAHFCAFVDFYTRKASDPMSTALACEKHAETLELAEQDATPENMRMLVNTMLEVIDHMEKKWLDEQIRHEERMLKHREDVSRLYRQIRDLQPKAAPSAQMYARGVRWLQNLLFKNTPGRRALPSSKAPRRDRHFAHRKPRVIKMAA